MPFIEYVPKKFGAKNMALIELAIGIINEYALQGYSLTLRQLYYQLVARGYIPNNQLSYDRIQVIVSDARRAGLIDWDAIVDRTRNLHVPPAWKNPAEIIKAVADQYSIDYWEGQPYRPEVWVEKDAVIGIIEAACDPLHIPFFSCRGYNSDSEIWAAAWRRMRGWIAKGQKPLVLYAGDHDPSGLNMTDDIIGRLMMFARCEIEVRRIALNMDQVRRYNPPPNFAKLTDSRIAAYREKYGDSSWELDALEPTVIANLINTEIRGLIDQDVWDEADDRCNEDKRLLGVVSNQWPQLTARL